MRRNGARQLVGLAGWLIASFAAAVVGGAASMNAGELYGRLDPPAWAPPASAFAPVWTVLYLMMAVAAWLVWRERGFRGAPVALGLFIVQLCANALWTWLFFAWRLGGAAFAEIVVLGLLVLATLIAFWRIRPLAGTLLVPYLLWVGYAAALNYAVWARNPGLL